FDGHDTVGWATRQHCPRGVKRVGKLRLPTLQSYCAALISFQRSARLVGSSTSFNQTSLSLGPALAKGTTVLPNPVRSESCWPICFCRTKLTQVSASSLSCTPVVIAQVSSQAGAPSDGLT